MPEYKVPLNDIQFCLNDVLGYEEHYANLPGGEEFNAELVDAVLEEGAKFCEQELAPLNAVGDEQGCRLEDGEVFTPEGFREAYAAYCDGGWPSLSQDPEFGGQGLPESLGIVLTELTGTANWAWTLYSGLSHGTMATLMAHGTEDQQQRFLPKLVEGVYTGTMCLTEANAGSDLALLKTKAEPDEDGTYSITGSKIFISAGDHDMSENVIHIVLARLPDAPAGVKGISLFIVPKINVDDNGVLQDRNSLSVGSIEHKMGINGNATCVMNFDGAKGYLIGPPNKGLRCMFTFMNNARLFIAQQGVCHAELSYQGALAYAKDRLQMRAPGQPAQPEKNADPIICHPDVRRMLLTQKAYAEGGRALTYLCAKYVDIAHLGDEASKATAEKRLALLIPIAKGFLTEAGFEAANLGVQVFGGHGYIKEWGMEQIVRDARIAMLYEGTNGIQALDLLGRKIVGSEGSLLSEFIAEVKEYLPQSEDSTLAPLVDRLSAQLQIWQQLSDTVIEGASQDPAVIGAASFDFLLYSGHTVLAYLLLRSAIVAESKMQENPENPMYQGKLDTARFYFDHILPRNDGLASSIQAGPQSMMKINLEALDR